MNTRAFRRVLSLACALALFGAATGCALPGYRSDFAHSGAWYKFGGGQVATYNGQPAEKHYRPRVVRITANLIRHQRVQRARETLGPAQQKVTAGGDNANYQTTTRYKIGRGDVLQIIVYGHPELTAPSVGSGSGTNSLSVSSGRGGSRGISGTTHGELVGADGTIFYPYVGDVKAAGLTVRQLRKKLAHGLADYIRQPQVDVRVAQYRSQRVYISGDISKPCTVSITDVTLTVLQALDRCDTLQRSVRSATSGDRAGGVGVQNVTLIRDGHATPLDLNEIYATGKPIPLQSGDRLLVDDSANRVFVVGEFQNQTALPYSTGGMALSDAIADAGGLNLETADTSAVYVIRGFLTGQTDSDSGVETTLRPNVYKLNASSARGLLLANKFQLRPRDVVFAAPASLVNFNRALAQITPSLDLLFRSFLIYDRARN